MTSIDTTADDALGSSDTVDLVARLARREVSAAELRDAAMARARAADRHLNAVTAWIDSTPRTEVTAPDDAAMAGIPVAIKDSDPITGHPATSGSRAVPDAPARSCSPIVALLLGLGADPIAITTMPEFGLSASSESSRYGATRNPWDTGRSVGGSSGGAAAMVAVGAVPLAHANDGGGSIRIPAACCGLVGLKPSRGRLPDAAGMEKLPVQMTVQGVVTRTVRDTALFYALAERARPAVGLPPIGHVTAPDAARLRIGICPTSVRNLPISPETVAAVRAAAELCASLGHEVVDVGPPVDDEFATDFLDYWALLALLIHRGGRAVYGPGFDPAAIEAFTRGLSSRSARNPERIPGMLQRLRRLAREHEPAFADYDVLLTHVTGHPAPPIGHLGPDVDFRTQLVRLLQFCSMTPVQNISGSPAISLPLGRTATGLPIGVQFAAPFGHERRLLELALELEAADPWPLTPSSQVPPGSVPL